jgi:hypothetical protein
MTNGNDSVYPRFGEFVPEPANGLTKREYFAAMAIQGLLANGSLSTTQEWSNKADSYVTNYAPAGKVAVEIADALIDALNTEAK